MKNRLSLYVMAIFYGLAGINHFRKPESYYKIIPPSFGHIELINTVSGIAEIVLAVLLLFNATRKWACYGIILLLLAFIPAHIYMLETGFCVNDYCAPQWALWVRLIILQPLLIWWAWTLQNKKT